jgi:pimeloyl-ACP methyl ester carboxylesterase
MEGRALRQQQDRLAGQFVDANGLHIYYEEHGHGHPLVLLNGLKFLIPYFADQFLVIAPDSRSQGRTDNPTGEMSYRLMADDTAAFIRALGLHRPALVGHSDGGQVLLELGVHHPTVAGTIVVSAARYTFTDAYVEDARQHAMVQADGRVDLIAFERRNPEWVARMREQHSFVYGPDHWRTLIQQWARMWLTPFGLSREDFERIEVPVLLVVGDHDASFPVEESLAMFRMIPKAELAVFPAADHSVPGKYPERFTRTVIEFLARHRTEDA